MKILVIDDEDCMQSIISAFITRYASEKNMELSVHGITDPVQALFELTVQGNQYGLITLDIRMPKLMGDEIVSSLLHINPELLERTIITTGFGKDLDERFPGHNYRVLEKPFRYQLFKASVEGIVQ